jgi:hypothetical protein
MEVAVLTFQVSSSHTEVIFIFQYFAADSQMEVAVVAFQVSIAVIQRWPSSSASAV